EFSYLHPLTPRLRLDIPVKIGMYGKREIKASSVSGLDVHVNYDLTPREQRVVPYALAGVGAVLENRDSFHVQIPVGLGIDLRLTKKAYINWQCEFRYATAEDKNNFHHGIGFRYFFGAPDESGSMPKLPADRDGDGIP